VKDQGENQMATTRSPRKAATKAATPATTDKTEYGEREDGAVSGNLTRDPDLRYTSSGKPVANLSIAVNDKVQDDAGNWVETETEFYDITAWGTLAENICEALLKGDRITATGYFQDQTYTNRDGERITKATFTARDLGPSLLWNSAAIKRVKRDSSTNSQKNGGVPAF
jgi:single-strand DNA-binding protein